MTAKRSSGKEIARMGQVVMISKSHYGVASQSEKNLFYDVRIRKKGKVSCTCKDYGFKRSRCKHIYAVEFFRGYGAGPRAESVPKSIHKTNIKAPDASRCPLHGRAPVIKKGPRKNMYYDVQVYYCKKCKRKFSGNLGFERLKASPRMVTVAINMYFNGESYADVADTLSLLDINVTPKTVENWVTRAIAKICAFVAGMTPHVYEEWRSDEIFITIAGKLAYLYLMMDDRTRYWITSHIGDAKGMENICAMFRDGVRVTGMKPDTLITDGAPNFHAAWNQEYAPKCKNDKKTQHIRHIHFDNDHNTNQMERANGEFRDREKTMRGLKSKNTPIIPGIIIRHNFIHKHSGLDGKTPAEASGIKIEGINKWLTLIQNAALQQTTWLKD